MRHSVNRADINRLVLETGQSQNLTGHERTLEIMTIQEAKDVGLVNGIGDNLFHADGVFTVGQARAVFTRARPDGPHNRESSP